MIFFIYQFVISIILIFSPFIIIFRIVKKKEDRLRIKEKFCFPSKKEVKVSLFGFMDLVWVKY